MCLTQERAVGALQFELTARNDELAKLKQQLTEAGKIAALSDLNLPPTITNSAELPPALQPKPRAERLERSHGSASEWRGEMELREIEELVTLTDAQREQLREKYKAEASGEKGVELREILGVEVAEKFEAEREQRRETARARLVDGEVFRLSRALGLTFDQEEATRDVMRGVSEEMREITRQVLPFERVHSPDAIKPEEAIQTMKELQDTRQSMLNQRMKEVLNEDQYNKFLADQANAPSRPWLFGR